MKTAGARSSPGGGQTAVVAASLAPVAGADRRCQGSVMVLVCTRIEGEAVQKGAHRSGQRRLFMAG
jgi:hypothetical protein